MTILRDQQNIECEYTTVLHNADNSQGTTELSVNIQLYYKLLTISKQQQNFDCVYSIVLQNAGNSQGTRDLTMPKWS